ncbi:MAG: OFA family MFS transporter [Gemmatimonadales bacterium]
MAGLLDRERTVAGPRFNRWLVPPAALAIHLSIGMAYGLSVFWKPLTQAIGITKSVEGDWTITQVNLTFALAIFVLGSSAAIFGRWLERVGPRKAGVAAAFCWGGGFLIAAMGVKLHVLPLLWLGLGLIGGCGLGLGYISPVSTLIKWFPDRRGLATGMAIMGFGGGAMIGAPLADRLMKHFASATSVGVWESFLVLGALYFAAMLCGAFGYRVPPKDWRPAGWTPAPSRSAAVTSRQVHVDVAWKTPQFWLLWGVLCLNVSAGIGVLSLASPMIQEIFGGRLIGVPGALADLTADQKAQVATIGAAFAALLSFFNILGRFAWASMSDYIGRKRTYMIFFTLGTVLYASIPNAGRSGSVALFAGIFCLILTMYGGGFATIPAYLADMFGTQFVGAIHGRLLTAWSIAGLLGPAIVSYIRQWQLSRGTPPAEVYSLTMYILAGLLVGGFICNLLVRPVADRYFMSDTDLTREVASSH